MPRPKNTVKSIQRVIYLPEDIDSKLQILLADPLTGKARYGARNALITRLLREWLETRITEKESREAEKGVEE